MIHNDKTILLILSLFLTLLCITSGRSVNTGRWQASTKCGNVTGKISRTSSHTRMFEFFNIPYAAPPVGTLRFEPPRVFTELNPWSRDVDATEEKRIECVQASWTPGTDGAGREDCLYLSIRSVDITASKPVVVWVHGGGLIGGYCCKPGYSLDAELTQELDAVTVNINYRLGFLGFHSIEELWDEGSGVYANNGIRDIVAALQWIQDNIQYFGGDASRVTVLGHSGGGTAVLALLSSPLAVNLFSRAVVLAPAPEFRFTHIQGSVVQKQTGQVLNVTGCINTDNVKKCLQQVDAKWLTSHINGYVNPSGRIMDVVNKVGAGWLDFPKRLGNEAEYIGMIMLDPTVIPDSPSNLSSAKFLENIDRKIKVIIGNNVHETVFYPHGLWNYNIFSDVTTVNNLIKSLSRSLFNLSDKEVADILSSYTGFSAQELWNTLTANMRATCPLNNLAEELSKSSKHEIYRLFVKYGLSPDFQVYHGWEAEALFGFKFRESLGDFSHKKGRGAEFRRLLVDMLRRFASDGEIESGWEVFPGNSLIIDDSEQMKTFTDTPPNHEQCAKLADKELDQYGWQN